MTEREPLRDARGRIVADYLAGMRGGRPWADDLRAAPGTPVPDLVAAIRAGLPDWHVSVDEEVGVQLAAHGAELRRHSHCYTWDLAAAPPEPRWEFPALPRTMVMVPAGDLEAAHLTPAWMSAYPVGHPDNRHGETFESAREQLAILFDGTLIGGLMPCSVAVLDGSRPIAACLVSDRPGSAPMGGPWITEVFRDAASRYAGLGVTVLRSTLARAAQDGVRAIGLTVTEGNRARNTYDKLGFALTGSFMTLTIPPAA
ncbi:GNAT family N-acetyltransferase [Yinghuangia soli]|uniref:GNAT family N-acetyltransferase n=1 Tax=Yinghuangia soli TaxID=2908204 RepID=A0AA41PY19_9ACTN|nr:GNAT family N-acetyltransferase [Yinghuangia soli]MCF2527286.1 GNAT family N-acetyltransferase [Yinghuangia soli]